MHLHIDAPPDGDPDFARVRVGKPGVVETRFTVIPVSSPPDALYEDSCFGFLHCPNTAKATAGGSNVGGSPGLSAADLTALKAEEPQQWWLQWWAKTETVSFSRQFDGRCEVQMKRLAEKPNEPFGISVRLNGQNWMHLAMGMDLLEGWNLARLSRNLRLFQATSEVIFRKASKKIIVGLPLICTNYWLTRTENSVSR